MPDPRRVLLAVAIALTGLATIATPALASSAKTTTLPRIRHVWVIMLENKDYGESFQLFAGSDPYLSRTLPSMGALLPYYFGVGHDSLDNYLALVSGQPPTADSKSDCDPDGASNEHTTATNQYGVSQSGGCWFPANVKTIADQLSSHHFTWRGYAEGMDGSCTGAGITNGEYAEKHNPFPYFASLLSDGECADNDVPLYPSGVPAGDIADSNLAADLTSVATTPNFSFIAPNECDDGHNDCIDSSTVSESPQQTEDQLSQDNSFLEKVVPLIMSSPAYKRNGMIVVTFDEGDILPTVLDSCCDEPAFDPDGTPPGGENISGSLDTPGPGGGQVGAVVLSPAIKPKTVSDECYNHYSLLHTMEDLFGLPYLGEAAQDDSNEAGGVNSFSRDVFTDPHGVKGSEKAPAPGGFGSAKNTGPLCETSVIVNAASMQQSATRRARSQRASASRARRGTRRARR
jgi:phosphatidylinositol-3-phosphatase